jgi:(E)-4-hydroxy-3-methylbut-2-enyl-diphosphate synthase
MPVRRKTRTVHIGDVCVGSEHPIRVQTMTTTDTKDVKATVEQVYKSAQSNHLLNSQFRFSV